MHVIFSVVFSAFVQLIGLVSSLSYGLASIARRPLNAGDYTLAAVVATSLIVGIGCAVWALVERQRSAKAHNAMCEKLALAREQIGVREAMISACPEAIAVLGPDAAVPISYSGGSALLQACLEGSDSAMLAVKLDTLLTEGTAFAVCVRTSSHPAVAVRGCNVGDRATVFLRLEDPAVDGEVNYRTILDALPMPVWFRNRNHALAWANRAFVAAANHTTLKDAIEADATLDCSEHDLVRDSGDGVVRSRHYAIVDGQRRALEIEVLRLSNANLVGTAIDVTDAVQAEAMLQLNADAMADVMNRIETAIVIFGKDKRLIAHNEAYARMWGFTEEWLGTHPSYDDVLDRLRAERRLPEQRDFKVWKLDQLQLFEKAEKCWDDTWHLPLGGSVHVKAYPYLLGGIAFLFEDITERLSMQVSYNMLAQMQRATLNTVDDGMAVFGPDGRLRLHNDAFVRLWQLSESELSDEPHITKVADLCVSHTGHDGIWNIVLEGVESAEPARYSEWGTVTRSDGRVLSLALSRLPLGATLVVFADLTDIKRFESGLKEKPSTAA